MLSVYVPLDALSVRALPGLATYRGTAAGWPVQWLHWLSARSVNSPSESESERPRVAAPASVRPTMHDGQNREIRAALRSVPTGALLEGPPTELFARAVSRCTIWSSGWRRRLTAANGATNEAPQKSQRRWARSRGAAVAMAAR